MSAGWIFALIFAVMFFQNLRLTRGQYREMKKMACLIAELAEPDDDRADPFLHWTLLP